MSAPVMARLTLEGDCNRCGQCCTIERGAARYACEHLIWDFTEGPGATHCAVYDRRVDGMPITLYNMNDRSDGMTSTCGKNSAGETWAILARGIGRQCSLQVRIERPTEEGQPC